MNVARTNAPIGLALAGLIMLSACANDEGQATQPAAESKDACASGALSGAGSTFQQNIEQQWISDFAAACPGAQINYQGTGSGAGIEQFSAGTIDFAGSDVTMKPEEQQKADTRCGGKAITVPVTAGGIAVGYNARGVDRLNLSPRTLAGIFQGTVKKWNDAAIAADNPDVRLPATAISPYHRADGSGTTSVFSSFLAATAADVWRLGVGKELQWPAGSGQAAKGSDGVVAGVKQTDGGITYAEGSFAQANGLPTARVKGLQGDFAELTAATVSEAIETGFTVTGTGNDVAGKVDFTRVQGYPISTVSYVIMCEQYSDPAKARLAAAFFTYAVTNGQQGVEQLGFAPLPGPTAAKAKAAFQSIRP